MLFCEMKIKQHGHIRKIKKLFFCQSFVMSGGGFKLRVALRFASSNTFVFYCFVYLVCVLCGVFCSYF